MEYLTSVVLSGITFELIKSGVEISTQSLREKLQGWLINDEQVKLLANHINNIDNVETLNQEELAKKLENEPTINHILTNTQLDKSVNKNAKQDNSINKVTQNHSGSGHNISGNVIINNK